MIGKRRYEPASGDRLGRMHPERLASSPAARRIAASLRHSGRLHPANTPGVTVPEIAAEYDVTRTVAAAAVRTCLCGGVRDLTEHHLHLEPQQSTHDSDEEAQ